MKVVAFVAVANLLFTTLCLAGPEKGPYKGSKEFEKMKSLVGTWRGEMDVGQGVTPITVQYRVVSNGSAIEERNFAGTPQEMITMYHDRGGRLAMTHYCSLHNQPGMILKSSSPSRIVLDFDPTCGIDAGTEKHMHGLTLEFKGSDSLVQHWTLSDGGQTVTHAIKLTRASE